MDATNVKIAVGDGNTRTFLLPIYGQTLLTVRVGGVEVFEGPDYDILTKAGQESLDIIVFRTVPAVGALVDIDFTGGTYIHLLPPLTSQLSVDEFLSLGVE